MKSKPILLCIFLSTIILGLSVCNVDTHNIFPLKANYDNLSDNSKRQVACLAENIYHEARAEPIEGQKAVAFVTINRVQSGYAEDICGVVKQKTGHTCQFSWYCDKKITRIQLTGDRNLEYNRILQLAVDMVLNFDREQDVTDGATYYHADYVNPHWNKLEKVKQIGRHIFYRSKKDSIDRTKDI